MVIKELTHLRSPRRTAHAGEIFDGWLILIATRSIQPVSLELLFQGLIAPTLIDCVGFAACRIAFLETALYLSGDEISFDVVPDPARRLRGWLFGKSL